MRSSLSIVAALVVAGCANPGYDAPPSLIHARFDPDAKSIPMPNDAVRDASAAQAVGVAPETVSLALTEMRLKNLVRTGRNKLTFNPAALEQFAARCNGNGASREIREEVAA